jgi:rhodanese-related sulfurtransferase
MEEVKMLFSKKEESSVTTKELENLLIQNTIVVIDVREPDEYRAGHIKEAKNVPLSKLETQLKKIPKDQDIYLICQSGMRSQNAYLRLKKAGYTKIKNVCGGMLAWRGALN